MDEIVTEIYAQCHGLHHLQCCYVRVQDKTKKLKHLFTSAASLNTFTAIVDLSRFNNFMLKIASVNLSRSNFSIAHSALSA